MIYSKEIFQILRDGLMERREITILSRLFSKNTINEILEEGKSTTLNKAKEYFNIDINELKQLKEFKQMQISMLLEKLQMPPMPSSAKARNYAMATKPEGLRLGWICNYKNALHSGPCACAKPQLGGKWIVLSGKNEKTND